MNFDTEKCIIEVQQREAIWNCGATVYKNGDLKQQQWEKSVDISGNEKMTSKLIRR
nr:unnamed protein product [Callosobruchus chinensis]